MIETCCRLVLCLWGGGGFHASVLFSYWAFENCGFGIVQKFYNNFLIHFSLGKLLYTAA